MACRLLGAKPLTEPLLACCQFYSWEQISLKFESEFCHVNSRKFIWKCILPKWRPFCPGGMSSSDWLVILVNRKSHPHFSPVVLHYIGWLQTDVMKFCQSFQQSNGWQKLSSPSLFMIQRSLVGHGNYPLVNGSKPTMTSSNGNIFRVTGPL